MKVGDYVRTKKIGIQKITFIDKIALECGEYSFETDISIPGFCDFSGEDIIGKSSQNIIDLIEVGDYVNGEKVLEVLIDRNMSRIKTELSTFFNNEIKSIVTKEQFEVMKYEIK